MPELLFKLRGVPDDEAEEVRQLLDQNGIRYYETTEGNWKIAVPAIWLPDASQLAQARSLLDEYQAERLVRARQEYQRQQARGTAPTLWTHLRQHPLRLLLYLGGIGVILYLSVAPFLDLGR